ncbi:MAG: TIGR04255 family protein [Nitrososphaera sp.]
MPIDEVFPNPTVKQVIFEIRFPNLFYIENRIGELQVRIMQEFPESSLILRRQVVLADVGPDIKIESVPEALKPEAVRKIWQFASPKNFKLNVLGDSLSITSEYHKTYNHPSSESKFRDAIAFVLRHFMDVMGIPIINRIGLRYINECPLPSKDTETYNEYYKTALNLGKFKIEDANEFTLKMELKKGDYFLNYAEALRKQDERNIVILDFDVYAKDIKSDQYLGVTDDLHDIIIETFVASVQQPIFDFMRKQVE